MTSTAPAIRRATLRAERDRTGVPRHDPRRAQGVQVEREPRLVRRQDVVRRDGDEPSLTVFLTGAECPFRCVFCDLWRHTTEEATPPGALPHQLREVLREVGEDARGGLLKLYNASNYFDRRAVPEEDDDAIVALSSGFRRVVVESHARLVGERCRRLADALDGRLQVAIGVETVHPEALPRLGKAVTPKDMERAAEKLARWDVELRAFVLVGAPFVPPDEDLEWVERSVRFALDLGAVAVSLIPLRPTQPAVRRLLEAGHLRPPSLAHTLAAWERCRSLSPGVLLDTWDLHRLPDADPATLARLDELGARPCDTTS